MGPGFGRRDRYIHGLLDKIVSSGIISVLAAHKIFPSLLPRASTARDHWSKQAVLFYDNSHCCHTQLTNLLMWW